jgi:hypothetical protein
MTRICKKTGDEKALINVYLFCTLLVTHTDYDFPTLLTVIDYWHKGFVIELWKHQVINLSNLSNNGMLQVLSQTL